MRQYSYRSEILKLLGKSYLLGARPFCCVNANKNFCAMIPQGEVICVMRLRTANEQYFQEVDVLDSFFRRRRRRRPRANLRSSKTAKREEEKSAHFLPTTKEKRPVRPLGAATRTEKKKSYFLMVFDFVLDLTVKFEKQASYHKNWTVYEYYEL